MEINENFETIKTEECNASSSSSSGNEQQKASLVTLSNDESTSNSSLASSHSNIDLMIEAPNLSSSPIKKDWRQQTSLIGEDEMMMGSKMNLTNTNNNNNNGYEVFRRNSSSSTSIYGTPRRQSSMFGTSTPILYDETNLSAFQCAQEDDQGGGGASLTKGCCLKCGSFAYLSKYNDAQLCDNCTQKHWQDEINELIKYKTFLESSVRDLKRYLSAKRNQCSDNIKSSQQIKKFINMTMQQIKRKVELELENKRDELFNSIDAFVENQKKISTSINEDTFQTSERICNEIENLLLNTDNDLNLFKLKSVKTFAKSHINKLNQQKLSRIPLYSIFFIPDSTVQVNNTFGKILLKSHEVDPNETSNQFDDLSSSISNGLDDEFATNNQMGGGGGGFNSEFSFLNNTGPNHFDASQLFGRIHSRPSSASHQQLLAGQNLKWTSFDNVFESSNLASGGGTSGNQSQLESGYATVRKYQPNVMRRAKLHGASNIPRLTKALSIHNASELDDLSENYEEKFARNNNITNLTLSNPIAARHESSTTVYDIYNNSSTTQNETNNSTIPSKQAAPARETTTNHEQPQHEMPQSKPFVPAKVLMSQGRVANAQVKLNLVRTSPSSHHSDSSSTVKTVNRGMSTATRSDSNSTSSSTSSMSSSSSSNSPTTPTSPVQKLIQSHNQAAAAQAATTSAPALPPAFKQQILVNSQTAK